MLIHRGKILKELIYKYCQQEGISITKIAKRAGYDQSTVYRHFTLDNLNYNILIRYGKAMRHDFSEEFPEMTDYFTVEEEVFPKELPPQPLSPEECMEQLKYYQTKYIELLEKHNKMLANRLMLYEDSEKKTADGNQ